MTEATRGDEKKPSEPSEQSGTGGQAPDPKAAKPAAEDAKRQDKTKDKADSGQNEDG